MGMTEGELLSWIEGQEALASEVFLDDMYCNVLLHALHELRNKLKEGEKEKVRD